MKIKTLKCPICFQNAIARPKNKCYCEYCGYYGSKKRKKPKANSDIYYKKIY